MSDRLRLSLGGTLRYRVTLLRVTPFCLALCTLFTSAVADAPRTGRRRAVLVGINDYSASRLGAPSRPVPSGRDWPSLTGAVNDVGVLKELLVNSYGFRAADVVILTDQAATRTAILDTISRHLLGPAVKGDVLLFYYAGHGSQVRNSLSDEPDKMDESLVAADSRAGARDIRDKELRPLFNRILDRGARLTVVLDNCHSGSGARGPRRGTKPRGVEPDLHDVADGANGGPRPEDRGALVLAAAQDFDQAWETRDGEGRFHGAFTWAWIRALRDASAGESAEETFLRAQARLRGETPYQEPVMAGNNEMRLSPFLGSRIDRRSHRRVVVAVQKVKRDGTVILQGGWANGLSVGCALRVLARRELHRRQPAIRLTVTAMRSFGESEAKLDQSDGTIPEDLHSGALLEIVRWAAPSGRPLRVWTPRVDGGVRNIATLARAIAAQAAKREIHWVSDPTGVPPRHLLRPAKSGWELVSTGSATQHLGGDATAIAAVSRIHPSSSLFVQLPAPAAVVEGIGIGPGSDREAIDPADRAEDADYVLVGRYVDQRLDYAWVRPPMKRFDRRRSNLPLRTDWLLGDSRGSTQPNVTTALRDHVLRLRRIHAWQTLESSPETRWPYRLALRRERDGEILNEGATLANEQYTVVLRMPNPPPRIQPRYVYVFTIDRFGKSALLFPKSGSVENRLPLSPESGPTGASPPSIIPLGPASSFAVGKPYGIDTYFLLSTNEPLPDPWILEWEGVRTRDTSPSAQLEQLLLATGDTGQSTGAVTSSTWSIERTVFESVAPPKNRG